MNDFEEVPFTELNESTGLLNILDRYLDAIEDRSIDDYSVQHLRNVLSGEKSFLSGQSMNSVEQFLRSIRKALSKRGVTDVQFKEMYQRFVERFQAMEREELEKRLFND
ncbi:MAG: hypothetical protein VYE37_15385 [Pseudomonadota bacterium]|nr:hypothetical protein [Pseudomonadota bacterium]